MGWLKCSLRLLRGINIEQIKCGLRIRNYCVQSPTSQELSQKYKLDFSSDYSNIVGAWHTHLWVHLPPSSSGNSKREKILPCLAFWVRGLWVNVIFKSESSFCHWSIQQLLKKKTTWKLNIYIYMCVCVCVCVCTHLLWWFIRLSKNSKMLPRCLTW